MTKEQLNKLIAMYIVGVGESGIPSSHLWLAVDPSMGSVDAHNGMLDVLTKAGLLKVSNHFVTLTEKGHALYLKLAAIYLPALPSVGSPVSPQVSSPAVTSPSSL